MKPREKERSKRHGSLMTKAIYTRKRYGTGSTEVHIAFPPQLSDRCSGGVPLKKDATPLPGIALPYI